jgi:HTH-type transcriptional regulator / antitoxin HigA
MKIRPIKTKAHHRAAVKEIERLMDAKPGTPAGDRLEILATLIDQYESQHERIEPPDPIEALLGPRTVAWQSCSRVGGVKSPPPAHN